VLRPETDRFADTLVEPAIDMVARWIESASELETRADRATMTRLKELISDDAGVAFVMQFVDRVARPDSHRVAASQLRSVVDGSPLPSFLSAVDRLLLRIGAKLGRIVPSVVIPLAKIRMRSIVGHLVAPAETDRLIAHIGRQSERGYGLNVNLLGEAVLGEGEATSRLRRLIELVQLPDIDYVSVKLSAIASQINYWDRADALRRVSERAADLFDAANATTPTTFVSFDMEEYHDLDLTVTAFIQVLSEPHRRSIDAGIVLQAYLPDSFDQLRRIVNWANARREAGGGCVKIRLVKGANLAMEKVDAAIHGWQQAPYDTKLETDANYRRCIDWLLHREHLVGVRVGIASHNLFDVAWSKLLSDARGVTTSIQFEMLQGMAPGQARAVHETTSSDAAAPLLLYTPAVAADDFDVAIGYLFRRLEENAAPDNFMRALLDLTPGSERFQTEAAFFVDGVELRHRVASDPRRTQDRTLPIAPRGDDEPFDNEPDTDPILKANQTWIRDVLAMEPMACTVDMTTEIDTLDHLLATARAAVGRWSTADARDRRILLLRAADELAARRGLLINAMMHEASKTFEQADVEVSEAIDFARWYADSAIDLAAIESASFQPLGVVAVIPPWNFPTAIPAGGVLAALAAGNAVVFKPAPQTPRCAELVAEALWAAGIPTDILQFVRLPDDDVGRHLIESVDGVILTGSSETAQLFQSWRPDLPLFAETSGKNALIITPSADLDLAVKDLVRSAFGHAGQKCSAASLAILVGEVHTSERFRRQLVDATTSLRVGPSTELRTDIAPLVDGGNERLTRAATQLEPGQQWLVEPRVNGASMSPGVIDNVEVDSWFHRTECFGPILGLMHVPTLEAAIEVANASEFGLTGGIHTLDPDEIALWQRSIEVGNGYVNRPTTGAIVRRQPFGGWKRSNIGPGAKAGGADYVQQLGTWTPSPPLDRGSDDYSERWEEHFSAVRDDAALHCEANLSRYVPLRIIALRLGPDVEAEAERLARKAAAVAGVPVVDSQIETESDAEFIDRMHRLGVARVRLIGSAATGELLRLANAQGIHIADGPVTKAGRVELLHYVRPQALSVTLHRFGNLLGNPRKALETK
jgi:RHH-type proline utilization regulon transcriptional repressor/proline dehydrogenase/delta 1-pyrroline-5-carboxylate dehydrogenase